jgi:hypothetical protein
MKLETRNCIRTAPIDVLGPRAMWNSAKVLDVSCFCCASGAGRLERLKLLKPPQGYLELLNFELPSGVKRSEQSVVVERLERLERTVPRDERIIAVEPFGRTQGRLILRQIVSTENSVQSWYRYLVFFAYLISLFALANTLGEIARSICLAVLRLITSSNFVGRFTRSSAGLAP